MVQRHATIEACERLLVVCNLWLMLLRELLVVRRKEERKQEEEADGAVHEVRDCWGSELKQLVIQAAYQVRSEMLCVFRPTIGSRVHSQAFMKHGLTSSIN